MTNITTPIVGGESASEVFTRFNAILEAYGVDASGYSTLADYRAAFNSLSDDEHDFLNGEVASSFLPKINWLNSPFEVNYDFTGGVLPNGFTLTRSSAATYHNAAGEPVSVAANVPRFEAGGLLLELSGTNFVTRSSDTAAFPWAFTTAGGITAAVVARGVRNGVPYTDISLNGANTTGSAYPLSNTTHATTAAAEGQIWTGSAYCELVSGTWPAGAVFIAGVEAYDAGASLIDRSWGAATPAAAVSRASNTLTLPAGTATARGRIGFSSLGDPGNTTFTGQVIRVYGWQLEQASGATSLIQSLAGAAAARAADAPEYIDASNWPLANGSTLFVDGRVDVQHTYGATLAQLDDGSNANRTLLGSDGVDSIQALAIKAGVRVASQSLTTALSTDFKAALSWSVNNTFQSAIRGAIGTLDTSAPYTRPKRLNLVSPYRTRAILRRVFVGNRLYDGASLGGMTA